MLGSKGPRRMKVLLPMVDVNGNQMIWRSADVSATEQQDYANDDNFL